MSQFVYSRKNTYDIQANGNALVKRLSQWRILIEGKIIKCHLYNSYQN